MKSYTEKEALDEIFSLKHLSPLLRTNKTRYMRGTLSPKRIQEILKLHNFVVAQETLYKKG